MIGADLSANLRHRSRIKNVSPIQRLERPKRPRGRLPVPDQWRTSTSGETPLGPNGLNQRLLHHSVIIYELLQLNGIGPKNRQRIARECGISRESTSMSDGGSVLSWNEPTVKQRSTSFQKIKR